MEGVVRSDHDLRRFTPYMDFIFPRLAEDARRAGPFAIVSPDEASAYLTDRLLGARYREGTCALSWLADRKVYEVFDEPDARKIHASMTLFVEASNDELLLRIMLDVWFRERVEEETMIRLGADSPPGTDFPPN